ncbi:sulfite exporter TauE/SafE family protein [Aquabacterium sp.]|uniref:sulfite exporter TauE/SafE family protein n=1 Tax=Aquabacterium sp. TaxID=1872578 RepID=UPI0025C66BE5|nr:sulfite exporter TauE/SafE family protein [Aquabacterium sp.]
MLLLAGALSGLIAGLVGLAGGIVIVPVLVWLYGPPVIHDAIVVSWFAVLFNSIGATVKQLRIRTRQERLVLLSGARYFMMGVFFITPLVACLAGGAKSFVSPRLVAILQLCLAMVMLWPVKEQDERRDPSRIRDLSFGGAIGGVSALIGVGGGTYTIAYFVYGAGVRFKDAIATANIIGSTVGFLSVTGYVLSHALLSNASPESEPLLSAAGMAAVIVGGLAFAPIGVSLSSRFSTKTLRQILIFALIMSSLRLMMS